MPGLARAAFSIGLMLAAAGCSPEPAIDPATFQGGVLRVTYAGAAEDIMLFVNPDGSLAGAEGAEGLDGWRATRAGVGFAAEADGTALAFDLPAAPFGPDFAGAAAVMGSCAANCRRDASAWWASGKERVTLPR